MCACSKLPVDSGVQGVFVSDQESLFEAICLSPEDDLLRMMFADLLEEQGHPATAARAAYIRCQIEAESLPRGSRSRQEFDRRLAALREQFRDEWDRNFDNHDHQRMIAIRRRGFVDDVQIAVDHLVTLGGRIFAAAPVRFLRILEASRPQVAAEAWEQVGRQPWLQRLHGLQLGPRLCQLNGLDRPRVDSPPMRMLLTAAGWNQLKSLELPSNQLDDAWLIAFLHRRFESSWVMSVCEIDLSDNYLTDASAYALAAAPWPRELTRIKLKGNRFSPLALAMLRRRFASALDWE